MTRAFPSGRVIAVSWPEPGAEQIGSLDLLVVDDAAQVLLDGSPTASACWSTRSSSVPEPGNDERRGRCGAVRSRRPGGINARNAASAAKHAAIASSSCAAMPATRRCASESCTALILWSSRPVAPGRRGRDIRGRARPCNRPLLGHAQCDLSITWTAKPPSMSRPQSRGMR